MSNKTPKLNVEQLQALSNGLLLLCQCHRGGRGAFTGLHALICAEVKLKVDKKLAAGHMPPNGVTLKLTPAQYRVMSLLAQITPLKNDVDFCNGITRLLALNK